jgi:hypothetical protein
MMKMKFPLLWGRFNVSTCKMFDLAYDTLYKRPMKFMIRLPFFGLVFLLTHASIWGQGAANSPILIERMTTEFIEPVRYQSNYRESGVGDNRNQWLEIRAIYEVRPEPATSLEDIQFKVFVESVEISEGGKAQDGLAVLLTGESTYINVGKGRWAVAFYVHPSTVERYGGAAQFEKKNVRLEAYTGGELVAAKEKKEEKDPNWFTPIKKVSGGVYTKEKSPFAFVDLIAYPASKLDK